MTITQANYWLVYRRLANKLMFPVMLSPLPQPLPVQIHTHKQKGRIDKGWRAWGKNPTHTLTDTANKLSFKLMFPFLSPSVFILLSSLSFSIFFCLCSRREAHLRNRCGHSSSRKPSWPNRTALNQSEQQHTRLQATNWGRHSLYKQHYILCSTPLIPNTYSPQQVWGAEYYISKQSCPHQQQQQQHIFKIALNTLHVRLCASTMPVHLWIIEVHC